MIAHVAMLILSLVALVSLEGCLGERNLLVSPEPGRVSRTQLPISVRVEIQEFTGRMNAVTPMNFDLRQALVGYINKRKTFREVLEGQSDSVLRIKAKFDLDSSGFTFRYIIKVQGNLLDGQNISLGKYEAEGEAQGGASRFTADADRAPTSEALNRALDRLFDELEADHQVILSKLGQVPAAAVAKESMSGLPIPVSDVDRVPVVKSTPRKNAYAIVIGIEQYREQLPRANFAAHDASVVGDYVTKVLGYPEENVVVRLNEKATKTDLEKYFEGWLPNNVEKDSSVFVYFSGHGAPHVKTGDAYLVPYDGDPTFVDKTGFSLKRLYAALDKLPAKDVTVVLDSCFSGAGGRSVLAEGARPMGLSIETQAIAAGRITVLSASSGDQISNTFKEQGHGLLTYFFLKGLQGDGDGNKDGSIEMVELLDYVKPNVQRIARKQYNNEQTPQLFASPDVLKRGGGRLIEARHP